MISRRITLNVMDNNANQNKAVVVYQNDVGIILKVKLVRFLFDIDNIVKINASVYNPDRNIMYKLKNLERKKDTIIVPIGTSDNGWVSLHELGNYYVHLHLFDEKGNRVTVPSFIVECKELIG